MSDLAKDNKVPKSVTGGLTDSIIFPVRFGSSLFRHRLRLFGFSARLADWKFFLFFADPETTKIILTTTLTFE